MSHGKIFKLFLNAIWEKKTTIQARLIIAFILSFLVIAIDLYVPILLKKAVNMLSGTTESTYFSLFLVLTAYGIIWSTSRILESVRERLSAKVLEQAVRRLSLRVFSHLHSLSLRYHLEHGKGGGIIEALSRVRDALPTLFWDLGFFSIPSTLQGLIALGVVGYLYGFLFACILGSIFIFFIIATLYMEKRSISLFREVRQAKKSAALYIADSFLNFETIKYFDKEEHEAKRCNEYLLKTQNAALKKIARSETIRLSQSLILGFGLISIVVSSGYATLHGKLTAGDFVLLNGYLFQFISPLTYIGYLFREIRDAIVDLEEIDKILETKPEIRDAPDATPLKKGPGEILFDKVKFSYDERRMILKNITFKIPAGKTVAIVGTTGSGKSTLSRLLFRFYNVSGGRILIDGQDIAKVTQRSLHSAIGIVPQDTMLFDETLYYNITYSNPEATQEEVQKAIEMAQLSDFIHRLPLGLYTIVGQRGAKLSGGERQRIAIARLLLKKPTIFIFDEATSALDTQTEKQIQANIREISYGHTTLIIAHRLSTISDVDKILVLKNGEVIEEGTHEQLLEEEGFYALLWKKQNRLQLESV